jgi:hypothetical protein
MVTASNFQTVEACIILDGCPQLLKGVGVASARAEGDVNPLIQTIHSWILSEPHLHVHIKVINEMPIQQR